MKTKFPDDVQIIKPPDLGKAPLLESADIAPSSHRLVSFFPSILIEDIL
jgi:hypothetical protein